MQTSSLLDLSHLYGIYALGLLNKNINALHMQDADADVGSGPRKPLRCFQTELLTGPRGSAFHGNEAFNMQRRFDDVVAHLANSFSYWRQRHLRMVFETATACCSRSWDKKLTARCEKGEPAGQVLTARLGPVGLPDWHVRRRSCVIELRRHIWDLECCVPLFASDGWSWPHVFLPNRKIGLGQDGLL